MLSSHRKLEYKKLSDRVSELHCDWKMFRFLFADTPSHHDLFNEVDGEFFSKVNSLFHERICMFLCRLGDPVQQGRKNYNLTLETLSNGADEEIVDKLTLKLLEYRESIKKFRTLRNKYYSHYDRSSELKSSKVLFSRAEVEHALLKLRDFMNTYSLHYNGNRIMYEHVITISNGEGVIGALKETSKKEKTLEK